MDSGCYLPWMFLSVGDSCNQDEVAFLCCLSFEGMTTSDLKHHFCCFFSPIIIIFMVLDLGQEGQKPCSSHSPRWPGPGRGQGVELLRLKKSTRNPRLQEEEILKCIFKPASLLRWTASQVEINLRRWLKCCCFFHLHRVPHQKQLDIKTTKHGTSLRVALLVSAADLSSNVVGSRLNARATCEGCWGGKLMQMALIWQFSSISCLLSFLNFFFFPTQCQFNFGSRASFALLVEFGG